jgi:hypothetical protein
VIRALTARHAEFACVPVLLTPKGENVVIITERGSGVVV